MSNQNYVPLGNFLKRLCKQSALGRDDLAVGSMAAQFAALSALHNGELPISELTRRTERLKELKAKFNATITDSRAQYRRQTVRAVSKLTQISEVAA